MKILNFLSLVSCCILLTACPSANYEDASDKLFKNNMDLPDPEKRYHDGIKFKISSLFEDSYNSDFVLKDNATTKVIYDLDLNFSVESFTKIEAEAYKFNFSEGTDLLNAVHDNYIYARQRSLDSYFTSVKKPVNKMVGFKGVCQSIQGTGIEENDNQDLLYLTATIEVGEKFYVFQLIGKTKNMGYLKDDFEDILNSIEK
jgi:hypothetical protein